MGDRRSADGRIRGPRALSLAAGLMFAALGTQSVAAGEIVRWVDADGVTQFTDPQLAAAPATVVEVQPANGMAVPSGAPPSNSGRATFIKISKAPKKNKRGWQGYQTSLGQHSSRYR